MPAVPVTIPIAFVQGMLCGVRSRGVAHDVFLADAGIDAGLLAQPGARVTAEQYVALFQSLTDRLDDDLLGLLSRPLRRGSFALIVRSAAAEDTLGLAMRRAGRTFGLLQGDVTVQLLQAGPLVGLGLRFDDPAAGRLVFLHELLLRSFWRLLAWLAGGRLPAERFDFAFAAPAHGMRPGMSPCRPYSAGDGSQEVAAQRCGSSSSMRLAGCVGSRSSTSLKYA
jgi:hypothetical protein